MRIPKTLIITLFALAPHLVVAQHHPNLERGFASDKVFQAFSPDAVNLFNGNLVITLPVGHRYPVSEHLSYGVNLVYTGKVWDAQQRCDGGTCYRQIVTSESSCAQRIATSSRPSAPGGTRSLARPSR
jgi:hypothetical protein